MLYCKIPEPLSSTLLLLLVPYLTFLEELKQQISHDQAFLQLRQTISDDPMTYPDYSIAQDLSLKEGQIWLLQASPFIPT